MVVEDFELEVHAAANLLSPLEGSDFGWFQCRTGSDAWIRLLERFSSVGYFS